MSGTIKELIETIEDLMLDDDTNTANQMADEVSTIHEKYWTFVRAGGKTELLQQYPTNQYGYYEKLFSMFGGKTMYNRVSNYSNEELRNQTIKAYLNTCKARYAKIAVKLEKMDVRNISEMETKHTHSGFNGVYTCETNAGPKLIVIETILAGGPVQRLHNRVLVKVQ